MPNAAVPFLREAAATELHRIADWWLIHSVDTKHGGFLGEIDYHARAVADANKGAVLNSRILWFFSEMAMLNPRAEYSSAADRAFRYLLEHFDDRDHGGVYWELDNRGAVVDDKKQTYALCFYIYALAAYYRLTSNSEALDKALQYIDLVERCGKDTAHGGYFEAFSRDWKPLEDVRLSDKDLNTPKTMNTHLHLLEAYTGLHRATPTQPTGTALRYAIAIFCEHILDPERTHLKLFFDAMWNSVSPVISYGHDIEASWLLWEASEVLGDAEITQQLRPIVAQLAEACLREGIGEHHQVCSEYDPANQHRSEEGIWWVQAEGLVGFLNAFQLTGESRYLEASEKIWQFIEANHRDAVRGEWHWLARIHNTGHARHCKAGFWKGPYHNGRAMLETCKRLDRLEKRHE